MKTRKLNRKGFSLLELLTVIAIIGILATIAIPNYRERKAKARQASAISYLNAIATAEDTFFLEHNGFHTSLKVIGFAPLGKVLYNPGFGADGPIPPTAPSDVQHKTTRDICGGFGGRGSDPNCTMPFDVPFLLNTHTITATSYSIGSLAFDTSLYSQNPIPLLNVVNYVIAGPEARAFDFSFLFGTLKVDCLSMDQNKLLTRTKLDVSSIRPVD